MPRAGLDTEKVVDAASDIVDRDGADALTLARVAERVGVKAPSLYNHVGGLEDLKRRLALRGVRRLADACRSATMGRSGSEALAETMQAYRREALEHPGLYRLTQTPAPSDDAEWEEASTALLEAVFAILAGYGLEGDDAVHAARTIRSAVHGFATLEGEGGFGLPQDLDETFRFVITTLDRGLRPSG